MLTILSCDIFLILYLMAFKMHVTIYSAFEKYLCSLIYFSHASHPNHKFQHVILEMYVIDQYKIVHNYKAEGKLCSTFLI